MATGKAGEKEHDFALILTGITELTREAEDALYEAGCDDATLCVRGGRVYVTFSRTAPSLKDAILSAIRDIRKARIGADVLRVNACDLVTQAEIARRMGRTRQLVHQYITGQRGPGGFPPPACHVGDEAPLWHWCEVAHWLLQHNMTTEEVERQARELALINNALELRHKQRLDPQLADEILQSVGRG